MLRNQNKKAIVSQQSLEAKAWKYATMKELERNADNILDGTFFDLKRDSEKNISSSLLSQMVEQKRNTYK